MDTVRTTDGSTRPGPPTATDSPELTRSGESRSSGPSRPVRAAGDRIGSAEQASPDRAVGPAWTTLGDADRAAEGERPVSTRRLVLQLALAVLAVLVVTTIGGSLAARRLAEREAVNVAARTADTLANAVVQPALSDELLAGDKQSLEDFDRVVRSQILSGSVVRVRIWNADGTIVYADQNSLIGRHFGLEDEELEALDSPRTEAEISDLSRPENALDRARGTKLVEVYRPVWTPSGQTALFEIYEPYSEVTGRTSQLWRGFAGVTLSTLLLFVVLVAPLVAHLVGRLRRAQRQRERMLHRTVDASATERRRIAATLHDGPVQDLAATSFVVAGATATAQSTGQTELADDLRTVSATVRTSIRALRTLLVDIYPASLSRAGLGAALADLAQTVRAEGLQVHVTPDPDESLQLSAEHERLVYRVSEETLRNAAKHAAPGTVTLTLVRRGREVVLDVIDDGPGFDPETVLRNPEPGHLGLQLLSDTAADAGATLQVASAPGSGTHWRLTVPDVEDDD